MGGANYDMPATYYDIRSRTGRQLGRALMMQKHRHFAKFYTNGTMLVDSDHGAVVLSVHVARDPPKEKSERTMRIRKDFESYCADTIENGDSVFSSEVAGRFKSITCRYKLHSFPLQLHHAILCWWQWDLPWAI
jgi:hypothetical protein